MNNHFTAQDKADIASAGDFHELADIAITVLERMRKNTPHLIVEVCGPMTTGGFGDVEKNMKFFEHSIVILEQKGMIVFNQIMFQEAMVKICSSPDEVRSGYCKNILDIFYRRVFESGYVDQMWFLPTWRTSGGARWERKMAENLQIPIREFPESWLKNIKV